MDYTKKFNIGLTLDTSLKQFEKFLQGYHQYIHSFYFSLPLGVKFHTRTRVALAFLSPLKRRQFYKMLAMIKSYGIELELLLNTLCLDDELIKMAADDLNKRQIKIDSVCFLEGYYDSVVKYFPNIKYIFSFNNGLRSKKDIERIVSEYRADTFVLGSNFIRDNELFESLGKRNKEVYLLLNNGCSFNCGTCNNTGSTCNETFIKNSKTMSVEYLFALQSIFPYEIKDGLIDSTYIKCFKISNRCSNIKFIREAMNSFIHNKVRKYVEKDKNSYAYWGRAGYFWKYFKKMDFDKIVKFKEQILKIPYNEYDDEA